MPTPVDTKKAPRRTLALTSLTQLTAELDAIEAAHTAGTLTTTGNWTPGQIFSHLAVLPECAIDGFPPGKVPFLMRTMVQLLFKKKAASGNPTPPGFKIPAKADHFVPDENTTFEAGLTRLRTVLKRIDNGEKMTHPSPLFGKLTHDQWTNLNLGHASLHLSFLSYPTA